MEEQDPAVFEVTGWQSTGGATLGFRFGSQNAKAFVQSSAKEIRIELDGEVCAFPIRASFWRHCPEVRGAAITRWMRRHGMERWPSGQPPRLRMRRVGADRFVVELPAT